MVASAIHPHSHNFSRVLGWHLGQLRRKDTEVLFNGQRVARFRNIEIVAMRKLAMLHRVVAVEELRVPPKNRLEKLKRDRHGQWSIRINDQWRVCFRFAEGRAMDAWIAGYH